MDNVPAYVSIVFLLTTFTAVGILLHAVRIAGRSLPAANRTVFLLALWIVFQSALSYQGFYLDTSGQLPRMFVFGLIPGSFGVAMLLFWWMRSPKQLPVGLLTAVHLTRIPVGMVLYWLGQSGQIPGPIASYGSNFELLAGVAAGIAVLFGQNRWLVSAFNIGGIVILIAGAATAVLSFPGSLQIIDLGTPNIGLLYFPYTFLLATLVPILLFAHLESLRQTLTIDAKKA